MRFHMRNLMKLTIDGPHINFPLFFMFTDSPCSRLTAVAVAGASVLLPTVPRARVHLQSPLRVQPTWVVCRLQVLCTCPPLASWLQGKCWITITSAYLLCGINNSCILIILIYLQQTFDIIFYTSKRLGLGFPVIIGVHIILKLYEGVICCTINWIGCMII